MQSSATLRLLGLPHLSFSVVPHISDIRASMVWLFEAFSIHHNQGSLQSL